MGVQPAHAENVPQQVLAVHPHQRRLGSEGSHRHRQVMAVVELAAEDMRGEFAEFRRDRPRADQFDEMVADRAVFDNLRDRDDLESEPPLEFEQFRQALDGPVVVHEFAEDPAGMLSGQDGQIHRRLGMTRPLQHAARAGAEGKHMARLDELLRGASCASASIRIVRVRSWALMPVVIPSAASTLTVKSVRWLSRLPATMGPRPSRRN